jgi:hypothetical protein
VLGDVDADPLERRLPGRAEGDQVGGRAAAGEHAGRLGRDATQLGQPPQRRPLEVVEGVVQVPLPPRHGNRGLGRNRGRRRPRRDEAEPTGHVDPTAVVHSVGQFPKDDIQTGTMLGQGPGRAGATRGVGADAIVRRCSRRPLQRREQRCQGVANAVNVRRVGLADRGVVRSHECRSTTQGDRQRAAPYRQSRCRPGGPAIGGALVGHPASTSIVTGTWLVMTS